MHSSFLSFIHVYGIKYNAKFRSNHVFANTPDSRVQSPGTDFMLSFSLTVVSTIFFFFFFFLEDLKSKLLGIRYNYNIKVYKTEDNARA